MKKKRDTSLMERTKEMWKKHIMQEKGYAETTAKWMADRIEALIDHMQYGHVVIAFHRGIDGKFQFVKATLINHGHDFKREYDATRVQEAVMFYDLEEKRWKRFRIENRLEWKPIV